MFCSFVITLSKIIVIEAIYHLDNLLEKFYLLIIKTEINRNLTWYTFAVPTANEVLWHQLMKNVITK